MADETSLKDEKIKELDNRLDAKERLIDELEKAASTMAGNIGIATDSVLMCASFSKLCSLNTRFIL